VAECQQVIDDETKELCNKEGVLRIGLGGVLCDEHYEYVKKTLFYMYGCR
jgi:hypothetical protein